MTNTVQAARLSNQAYLAIGLGLFAGTAAILFFMGQVPICKCGYVKLWHSEPMSSENSQHIADWYSLSHVIHGFAFYAALAWLARSQPVGLRLSAAIIVEAAWEIFENTDFVINRYREVTISLDYYGDSVINSVSDIGFMVLGFLLAGRFTGLGLDRRGDRPRTDPGHRDPRQPGPQHHHAALSDGGDQNLAGGRLVRLKHPARRPGRCP